MKLDYDYIICGAGAAGLSLAYRLATDEFRKYQILIIDKDKKQKNDRTWSIWTKGDGPFDHLAEKSWSKILFRNEEFEQAMEIDPFIYIKIRGIDFYDYTLEKIRNAPNITFIQDQILSMDVSDGHSTVKTLDAGQFTASWIFNSTIKIEINKTKHNYVDQHFKGWFIKTKEDEFDTALATLMDFNIPQENECRFMYVLPTSANQALVEVAIFSNNILEQDAYDDILKKYINDHLKIIDYQIEETEYAIIPMTTFPFEQANEKGITHIGTAGAGAKGSTGYAFLHIQDQVDHLVQQIRKGESPSFPKGYYANRYRWFDDVLLNVLLNNRMPLGEIFGDMFRKLPPSLMLKFLSNKTTLLEDLRILSTPKFLPFIKAAINEFWKTK